jgi:hypothetical protein
MDKVPHLLKIVSPLDHKTRTKKGYMFSYLF